MINDEIKNVILEQWRPNQDDSYIKVVKGSEADEILFEWFKELENPSINPTKIDIGPFIGVQPYGRFERDDENSQHGEIIEYLFIYDNIDYKKLTINQLKI